MVLGPASLLTDLLDDFIRVVHDIVADGVAANLDVVLLGHLKHLRLLHARVEFDLVDCRHDARVARHLVKNIPWVV